MQPTGSDNRAKKAASKEVERTAGRGASHSCSGSLLRALEPGVCQRDSSTSEGLFDSTGWDRGAGVAG